MLGSSQRRLTFVGRDCVVQLQHWLALVGGPVAVYFFFAVTAGRRPRGDVALAIALVSFVLIMIYLLQDGT